MIAKPSPLVLDKIWVHAGYFVTVYADKANRSKANFDIPLDLDFEIHKTGRFYKVRVEAKTIDDEEFKDEPGYKYSVFSEAIFKFSGRLRKEDKDFYIKYSGVSLVISYIRGYLANVSSYGYYGQYILPAIDLNDLVARSSKQPSL